MKSVTLRYLTSNQTADSIVKECATFSGNAGWSTDGTEATELIRVWGGGRGLIIPLSALASIEVEE